MVKINPNIENQFLQYFTGSLSSEQGEASIFNVLTEQLLMKTENTFC